MFGRPHSFDESATPSERTRNSSTRTMNQEVRDPTVEELLGETPDTHYTNDDVAELTRWFVNERCSPEVLPYQQQIIENLQEMMDAQQDNIDGTQPDSSNDALIMNLYQQEMERVRFLIRNYLRTRLAKIHKYTLHSLKNDEIRQRLSVHELDFAEKYNTLLTSHFERSCLDQLPPFLRRLDDHNGMLDMVPKPDLNDAVICKVERNIGPVFLKDSGETVDMQRDNVYILRYNAVRSLIESGGVSLL